MTQTLTPNWSPNGEHGWEERLVEARELLADPMSSPDELRRPAGEVFTTAETEETLWWDSWLAPLLHQAGGNELRELVENWQHLTAPRRARLLEFACDQAELSLAERYAPAGSKEA